MCKRIYVYDQIDKILDIKGFICPEPIQLIRKEINLIRTHQIILVVTDDPSTKYEIPAFCRFMEHTLLMNTTLHLPYFFMLRK
ncbi:sulfurtransferase TusA [Blochmannia endosymbiont of Colobopsis nipponica]|uniref:sulfurtransferase TusA n=1 Tax=Blochmannia endosymbiont of Colobopsis nipponica TaxID=2681987 RepID=UPI00177DCA14|nr:sulfurtransferase TusA [Blochmannia endosymbiont of Colobopsis nipponica]QOI10845.1 sulfurtransferase TusA [Blochmannia endosymbiont of Colobopsis nipponica]